MKIKEKFTAKNLSILAAICIAVGIIFFGVSYLVTGGKLGIMVTNKGLVYAFNEKDKPVPLELSDLGNFKDIEINTQFADIYMVESDKFAIEATNKDKTVYSVENDKLVVGHSNRESNSYEYSIMLFRVMDDRDEKIYIYYPKDSEFGIVKLKVEHADFSMANLTAEELDATFNFVNSEMEKIKATKAALNLEMGVGNYGDITTDDLNLKAEFGDLNIGKLNVKNKARLDLEHNDVNISEGSAGDFEAKEAFSNLHIATLNTGDLKLNGEHGDYTVDKAQAKNINIETQFANVILTDIVANNVDVELEQGNLDLYGKVAENINIKSSFANVGMKLNGDPSEYLILTDTEFTNVNLPSGYSAKNVDDYNHKITVEAEHGYVDIDIK